MQPTFSLHPAQHEVYRAQLSETDNPLYNVGGYVKLKGRLDKETFTSAVCAAPSIFDAFRMRFHLNETDASCFFDTAYDSMPVSEYDLSAASDPEAAAICWIKRQFNVPFDIQKESQLFQNVLIKVADDEYWFFMRYHHLLMDGYGFKVWLQYLARQYKLSTAGDDTLLTYPLYKTEIQKANDYRNAPGFRLEAQYWKDRIAEKPKKLLHRRYHQHHGRKASTYSCRLTDGQRKLLGELNERTKASIQQLTIAALLIYFGKTEGASDLVLGILLHKRESRQIRSVLGMFSSILPYKGNFEPGKKLKDFLREITVTQKQDYRHKNYLLGDIGRELHINPFEENLCEITVNYEWLDLELDFGDEIEATAVQQTSESERIPLQFCWQDFGNHQPLQLQVIFREDHFTKKEVELLTERLLFILEQFPAKFEENIGSIEIIPAAESRLLRSYNGTEADYPLDQTITDMFEAQAEKTPGRKALLFNESQLTYEQLNEKANQLAHYLRKKGVTEGMLVPICIERSLDMIVGILGILKAGGTYVPVDPTYPAERIKHMLEDTEARVVITSAASEKAMPAGKHADFVKLDKEWPLIAQQPGSNLMLSEPRSALAYVIYTSGSTGRPKGVKMPGRNLVNLLMWQEEQFRHPHRHVLQYASLNFDVSFQEIFSTLCFGGTLSLIHEWQRSDMPELSRAINRYDITHLFLPCIVLQNFAEYITAFSITHLPVETIIVAGEQLQLTGDIKRLLESSGITLINQYGPTEAHVVSSYTIATPQHAATMAPIGAPISNNCIHILDHRQSLLPIGVAGEICITGAGVADGYLNNEVLTARKFINNPFGEGKMYRTGDIGRWLPGGTLEFLGRTDDQVKIRGHRIEPGEVESVLQQCNLVRQCVVVAGATNEGTKQLVCYIVPKQSFDRRAIVSFLESRLPPYMIPSLFIELEALPVTINGKVDKMALPAPGSVTANEYVAPGTAMEKTLAEIWQEVLAVEPVSIHDNFFELGGHSLLVVKTMARIKQHTGRNLPPSSLFQHPTIEKYASFLSENPSVKGTTHIVPLKKGNGKMPLYIICHIGVAPLTRFIQFAGLLDERQPVYGIQLPEVSEMDTDSISIEAIAAKYVADLLEQDPDGPYAFAGYSIGGLIAVEMAKQLEARGKKVTLLCLFDTIAYTKEAAGSTVPVNAIRKKQMEFYAKLTRMAHTLYYKIDNNIYLLKLDTRSAIRSKRNMLLRRIKNFFRIRQSPEQQPEVQPFWKEIQKMSLAAYEKYKLTPYDGNITLFRTKRRTFYFADPKSLGWRPYAKAVKVYETEGNHYTMFHPSHCTHLAKQVQQCLDGCEDNRDYRSL